MAAITKTMQFFLIHIYFFYHWLFSFLKVKFGSSSLVLDRMTDDSIFCQKLAVFCSSVMSRRSFLFWFGQLEGFISSTDKFLSKIDPCSIEIVSQLAKLSSFLESLRSEFNFSLDDYNLLLLYSLACWPTLRLILLMAIDCQSNQLIWKAR